MSVLLIAEFTDGELVLDATAKAVTAAKALGDVTVLCRRFGPSSGRRRRENRRCFEGSRCRRRIAWPPSRGIDRIADRIAG